MRCSKHLEAIKPNVEAGKIVMGGASLEEPVKEGEGMKANGSAMLCVADTEEDVKKLIESDVYYKSGVWDPSKVRTIRLMTDGVLRSCVGSSCHS